MKENSQASQAQVIKIIPIFLKTLFLIPKVKSMVSSLWVVANFVGGWVGSSLGGLTYDQLGFESSSVIVTVVLAVTSVALAVLWLVRSWRKDDPVEKREEGGGGGTNNNKEMVY